MRGAAVLRTLVECLILLLCAVCLLIWIPLAPLLWALCCALELASRLDQRK